MAFPLTCAACKKSFSIPDEIYERRVAGRVVTIKCKSCRTPIRVDGTKNPPVVGGDATAKVDADLSLSPKVPAGPSKAASGGSAKERPPAAVPAFKPKARAEPFRSPAATAGGGTTGAALRPGLSATTPAAKNTPPAVARTAALSPALRPGGTSPGGTARTPRAAAASPFKPPAPAAPRPPVAAVPTDFTRTSPESPAARKPSEPGPLEPELTPEPESAVSEETLWAVDFGDEDDRELTSAGVLEELSRGTITAETLAWTEGMDDWQPLAQIPELAPLLAKAEGAAKGRPALPSSSGSSPGERSLDVPKANVDFRTTAPEAPSARAAAPARHEEAIAALESIEPEPPSEEPVMSAELLPPSVAASPERSRPALHAPLPPFPAAPFPASAEPDPTPTPPRAAAEAPNPFPPAPSAPKAPPPVETTPFGIPAVTNAGALAGPAAGPPPAPPFAAPALGSPSAALEVPDFGARKKRGVWLGVGAVALLAIGATIFVLTRPSAEQTPAPAPVNETASVNPVTESTTRPTSESPTRQATQAESEKTDSPAERTPAARGAELDPESSDFAEMFERAAKNSDDNSSFDEKAAKEALSTVAPRAHRCRQPGDPPGVANVVVQFAPSGRVKNARVDGPPLEQTATAACIADAMMMARIPAFSGAGGQVVYPITIR